jgi:ferredoxin--NADP+ reductase
MGPSAGTLPGPAAARRPPLPPRAPRPDAAAPNATIVEREDVSATIVRLRVRPDAGVPAFEPGQYLALGLAVDGELVQRPYSISSPRGESDALEFLVRLVPQGALTPRLWRLGRGARLRLGRPRGLFSARGIEGRRPLFVATGTGIAPLLSMLATRLGERPDGPARSRPIVVHGAAFADDLVGREMLHALADRGRIAYVPSVSRPADPLNAGWRGDAGRVDALLQDILAAHAVDPPASVAFLCGNPAMIHAAGVVLRRLGLPAEAVRSEAY